MGVDYSCVTGIGYEIEVDQDLLDSKYDEDFSWYADEVNIDGVSLEQYGDAYSEQYRYMAVLIDPFRDGLDLTARKEEMDRALSENNIKIISDFGEVGGIRVW